MLSKSDFEILLTILGPLVGWRVYDWWYDRRTRNLILNMLGETYYMSHKEIMHHLTLNKRRRSGNEVWHAIHDLISKGKIVSEMDSRTFREVFKLKPKAS